MAKKTYKEIDGLGNIWSNQYKTEDKHPDFSATMTYDGKPLQVAIWLNTTKTGKAYATVSLKDALGAELERTEKRLEELHNIANLGK
tara:strand:+ start:599 stop:859 length:261 start_codon:yes stop_codon:yes gene_type:complete